MSWLVLVLLSVLLSGIGAAINRYVLRDEHVYSYSFLFTFLSSLFFVPLMLTEEIILPQTTGGWLIVLAAGVLWWTINIIGFMGISKTDVTLSKPLASSKVVIVFLLSVLVLGEAVTAGKIIGTILVMAGMLVLTWKKGWFTHLRSEGVQLLLAAAVIMSVVHVLDKYNMGVVSPNFYGFLMYFIPAIPLGVMAAFRLPKLKQTIQNKWKAAVLVAVCYGAMYYFILQAYRLADLNAIYPILQLATLVTMGMAYFWLKEKAEFRQRVAGAALMILGAVLVTLGA
ncbi:MAG: DMT family transporter [Candidatus Diapherotrites archaeon]|nr:DMT family transporter [Candidatus Diapherotrites archaeon]